LTWRTPLEKPFVTTLRPTLKETGMQRTGVEIADVLRYLQTLEVGFAG